MRMCRLILLLAAVGCESETSLEKGSLDEDGDGFDIDDDEDCDDSDPEVHPGAPDVCGDNVDGDCDGAILDCDDDGDTYSSDDCDDDDPNVHPGRVEDCATEADDNCNGETSECAFAWMIYEATTVGPNDPASTTIIEASPERVLFGDPSGGANVEIGRGRVVAFDLQQGTVTELDAAAVMQGPSDQDAGFGSDLVTDPFDGPCVSAASFDPDPAIPDGGKTWCYAAHQFEDGAGALDFEDASYTVTGLEADGFARADPFVYLFDDDGRDVVVSTASGLYAIGGDPLDWPWFEGDYFVPDDADLLLATCSPPSGCGHAIGFDHLAIGGAGGAGDTIGLYELPLDPDSSPTPVAEFVTDEAADGRMAVVPWTDGDYSVVGEPDRDRIVFFDEAGVRIGSLEGLAGERFGAWVSAYDNYLLVGAPLMVSDGQQDGGAYVYPSGRLDMYFGDHGPGGYDPLFVLLPPEGFTGCGARVAVGLWQSTPTIASMTCPGSGGVVYVIDEPPLLIPPAVVPAHVTKTGPNAYTLERSIVSALWKEPAFYDALAQTERVDTAAGVTTGWRLHRIRPGSPLHLAGLREGDVIERVNNTALSSPKAVNQTAALVMASALVNPNYLVSVKVRRNNVLMTFTYRVVP